MYTIGVECIRTLSGVVVQGANHFPEGPAVGRTRKSGYVIPDGYAQLDRAAQGTPFMVMTSWVRF
jgi:hypothetical protein